MIFSIYAHFHRTLIGWTHIGRGLVTFNLNNSHPTQILADSLQSCEYTKSMMKYAASSLIQVQKSHETSSWLMWNINARIHRISESAMRMQQEFLYPKKEEKEEEEENRKRKDRKGLSSELWGIPGVSIKKTFNIRKGLSSVFGLILSVLILCILTMTIRFRLLLRRARCSSLLFLSPKWMYSRPASFRSHIRHVLSL